MMYTFGYPITDVMFSNKKLSSKKRREKRKKKRSQNKLPSFFYMSVPVVLN